MMPVEDRKLLVLCIDRDNDLGTKAGIDGPIIGREANLKAAEELALIDAEETDVNTIFKAVNTYDRLVEAEKQVQISTLTGDPQVGIKSDMEISRQLEKVLEKRPADGVIMVTDGAEDEHILPLVESRIEVDSIERVVVRQSEQLESTYFVVRDFFRDLMEDPRLKKIMIGLPGVAAILYFLLGATAWRFIIGVVGFYFLVKGFGLEEYVNATTDELRKSVTAGRISFFTYIAGLLVGIASIVRGYDGMMGYAALGTIQMGAGFFLASDPLLIIAILVVLGGKVVDTYIGRDPGFTTFLVGCVFIAAIRWVFLETSRYVIAAASISDIIISIIFGVVICLIAIYIAKELKKVAFK